MKWRFFTGACLLVGWLMSAVGAPLAAVAAGIGFAAVWNFQLRTGARFFRRKTKTGGIGSL
jgi:hypothetical protein